MPNTIADNLLRLQTARTDIANAITTMGGTVSAGDGFEDFPAEILGIPAGSQIVEGVFTPLDFNVDTAKVWGCDGFIFGYVKGQAQNGSKTVGSISGISFPSERPSTYVFYGAGAHHTSSYGGMETEITGGGFNFSNGKVSFSSGYTPDTLYAYFCFIVTW